MLLSQAARGTKVQLFDGRIATVVKQKTATTIVTVEGTEREGPYNTEVCSSMTVKVLAA